MFLKNKNQAGAGLCVPAQRSSGAGRYFLVLMNKAGSSAFNASFFTPVLNIRRFLMNYYRDGILRLHITPILSGARLGRPVDGRQAGNELE